MAPRLVLCCLLVPLAAGCGADEERPAEPGTPPPAAATELRVRVDRDGPEGGAEPREAEIRCDEGDSSGACAAVRRLRRQDFRATPADVVCTQIYGGPATAEVSGTLHGEPVSARFSRANGCEIHRWDTVAPLLEQVG